MAQELAAADVLLAEEQIEREHVQHEGASALSHRWDTLCERENGGARTRWPATSTGRQESRGTLRQRGGKPQLLVIPRVLVYTRARALRKRGIKKTATGFSQCGG